MLKKLISVCLVLCMAFTLMIPGYAKPKEKISSDTVITKDNVYDVLKYLGIDSSNFEPSGNVKSGCVTVWELEKTISEIKNAPTEPKTSKSFATSDNQIGLMAITVNKSLYHTSDYDQYSLTVSCTGTYDLGTPGWIGCSGGSASVDYWNPIVAKINGNPSINTYLNATKTQVCMAYTVVVDKYVGIANSGIIYIGSATHTGNAYWSASEFVNI